MKNKFVIEVPTNKEFVHIERIQMQRAGWSWKRGRLVRVKPTVPVFGTKEMHRTVESGQMLVFIESSLDEMHEYAWNLYVMSHQEYAEWVANE